MFELTLKNPLSQERNALLALMARICRAQQVDFMMVGATARDVLMHHLYDFPIERASWDMDFAVSVSSWEVFHQLKTALLESGQFMESTNMPHRLDHFAQSGQRIPVDLVPFGGVEDDNSTIAWPPDMVVLMSVLGFQDVAVSAVQIRISDDQLVKIASLPGLAMTKLIAWLERGKENPKDASDLRYFLERYADAGNADRLHAQATLLEAHEYDIEIAGAQLLGMDAAAISPDARDHLQIVLFSQGRETDRLLTHMLKGRELQPGAFERLKQLFDAFQAGFATHNQASASFAASSGVRPS